MSFKGKAFRAPPKTRRCNYYDDDGTPRVITATGNTGCTRSAIACHFAHPFEPEWDTAESTGWPAKGTEGQSGDSHRPIKKEYVEDDWPRRRSRSRYRKEGRSRSRTPDPPRRDDRDKRERRRSFSPISVRSRSRSRGRSIPRRDRDRSRTRTPLSSPSKPKRRPSPLSSPPKRRRSPYQVVRRDRTPPARPTASDSVQSTPTQPPRRNDSFSQSASRTHSFSFSQPSQPPVSPTKMPPPPPPITPTRSTQIVEEPTTPFGPPTPRAASGPRYPPPPPLPLTPATEAPLPPLPPPPEPDVQQPTTDRMDVDPPQLSEEEQKLAEEEKIKKWEHRVQLIDDALTLYKSHKSASSQLEQFDSILDSSSSPGSSLINLSESLRSALKARRIAVQSTSKASYNGYKEVVASLAKDEMWPSVGRETREKVEELRKDVGGLVDEAKKLYVLAGGEVEGEEAPPQSAASTSTLILGDIGASKNPPAPRVPKDKGKGKEKEKGIDNPMKRKRLGSNDEPDADRNRQADRRPSLANTSDPYSKLSDELSELIERMTTVENYYNQGEAELSEDLTEHIEEVVDRLKKDGGIDSSLLNRRGEEGGGGDREGLLAETVGDVTALLLSCHEEQKKFVKLDKENAQLQKEIEETLALFADYEVRRVEDKNTIEAFSAALQAYAHVEPEPEPEPPQVPREAMLTTILAEVREPLQLLLRELVTPEIQRHREELREVARERTEELVGDVESRLGLAYAVVNRMAKVLGTEGTDVKPGEGIDGGDAAV